MDDNLLQGTKYFIKLDFPKAIESFSKLIESSNKSDQILGFLYRGTCLLETEELIKALEDFKSGLKLNPNSFELKYKIGIAYFKSKQFEEADQSFRSALINSNNSEQREKLILWQSKSKLELDSINELKAKKIGNMKFSNNWFQTDESIILTLDSNAALNKSLVSVKIEKRIISILFEDTKIYEVVLSNAIDETKSSSKILTQKIELNLIKEVKGYNWITLDEKSKTQVQSYPTSMKKDFNAINKELDEMIKGDKNDPSGNDAMMTLFREIYSNANEETRRAMMKSYATSGGTVLSTNWDEVKSKDYEGKDRPEAPQGQQWVNDKDKK